MEQQCVQGEALSQALESLIIMQGVREKSCLIHLLFHPELEQKCKPMSLTERLEFAPTCVVMASSHLI